MNRALILTILAAALLSGCGQRQAIEPASGKVAKAKGIPNDSGGYAKDLADPPAKEAVVDVEKDIQARTATDSRDPMRDPGHDEDKAKAEQDKAKAKADEQADLNKPANKDTSGDARWANNKQPVVAFQFNRGVVYFELWPDVAPKHAANMLKLVKAKFYDGIFVHRVEPGFVVQAGDPLTKKVGPQGPGVGTGGPGWTVPAEFSNKPHLRGTLSMARSQDPNSGGSQFFICLGRCEQLDGKYSVFGQVLGDGMDTVDKIKVGDLIHFAWVVKE